MEFQSKHLRNVLQSQGIDRIVVGHKPVGDCPLIIREDNFELIMADTSYSDSTKSDNRGFAVFEILIKNGRSKYRGHSLTF